MAGHRGTVWGLRPYRLNNEFQQEPEMALALDKPHLHFATGSLPDGVTCTRVVGQLVSGFVPMSLTKDAVELRVYLRPGKPETMFVFDDLVPTFCALVAWRTSFSFVAR